MIIKYIEFFILTYEVIIHNFILFCCWLTHRELVIDKMNRNAKQIVWRFQICSVKSDGSKEIARRDQSPVYNKSILKKSNHISSLIHRRYYQKRRPAELKNSKDC